MSVFQTESRSSILLSRTTEIKALIKLRAFISVLDKRANYLARVENRTPEHVPKARRGGAQTERSESRGRSLLSRCKGEKNVQKMIEKLQ